MPQAHPKGTPAGGFAGVQQQAICMGESERLNHENGGGRPMVPDFVSKAQRPPAVLIQSEMRCTTAPSIPR